jgi:DNA polymerase III subunit epsilon
MLREIVLDTETTGTDWRNGAVELLNHIPTGRTHHVYVNPERPVSQGAFDVHGLSDAFLADKPRFAEAAPAFLAFAAGARMVIHNAAFDVGFLNMEYARLGADAPPAIVLEDVVDTLALARRRHPGAANSLDALCTRYGIDNSRRTKHGALLDAQILADVYIELLGGKQTGLDLAFAPQGAEAAGSGDAGPVPMRPRGPRPARARLTEAERMAHAAFVGTLGGSPIWADYENGT